MEHEFSSGETFAEFVAHGMESRTLGRADLLEFGAMTADAFKEASSPEPRRGTLALIVPGVMWVIKDDDLKLFDAILDGAAEGAKLGGAAWVSSQATAPSVAVAAVVGVAATVIRLGRQALRKGRRLSQLEYDVLVAVRSAGGVALADEEVIARVDFVTKAINDPGVVLATLGDLSGVAVGDGQVTNLVSKDARGRWRVAGV